MTKRKPSRKPRSIRVSNIVTDLDDVIYLTMYERFDEKLYLEQAKDLHTWLGKAIRYLEGKKK